MDNFIGCVTAFIIALLLSTVESISIRQAKIVTILGWAIALCFAKGGIL